MTKSPIGPDHVFGVDTHKYVLDSIWRPTAMDGGAEPQVQQVCEFFGEMGPVGGGKPRVMKGGLTSA